MDSSGELQALGDRIERLLDDLRVAVIPREYEHVEEVVRLVTELYGAALERVVSMASDSPVLTRMVEDQLVAGLLIVHGLHPDSTATRVEAALASVRPFLASHHGDVELLDIDEDVGAVRLRLLGSCDGCPSSSVTLQLAVEKAIHEAAPEVVVIDVDGRDIDLVPAGVVGDEGGIAVALGRKALYDACPTEVMAT